MTEFNTISQPKIAGFVDPHKNNANANQRRIEREEAELKALMEGNQPLEDQVEQEEPKEPVKTEQVKQEVKEEKLSAEEETYKKRYGDLRNHMNELNEKIKKLEEGRVETVKPPKSDEDIAAWSAKYPDVAAIVETIAERKAAEKFKTAEERLQKLDEKEKEIQRNDAINTIRKAHPDFDDIQESDEFHNWAAKQTKRIQDALYEEDSTAQDVIIAINAYKYDTGKGNKAVTKEDRDAATAIMTKRNTKPTEGDVGKTYTESQIQKMSLKEYEKLAGEIEEARRAGRFVYDISGAAR